MQNIDIEQIVLRLKRHLNVDSAKEVSIWLGFDSDFIADKKRKTYGPAEIVTAIVDKCIQQKIDVDYILTGEVKSSNVQSVQIDKSSEQEDKKINASNGAQDTQLLVQLVESRTEARLYKEQIYELKQQIAKANDQQWSKIEEYFLRLNKSFETMQGILTNNAINGRSSGNQPGERADDHLGRKDGTTG